MVTSPIRVEATLLMPIRAMSRSSRMRSTCGRKARPTMVRLTRRVVRSNSFTPRAVSSFSMRRLSGGGAKAALVYYGAEGLEVVEVEVDDHGGRPMGIGMGGLSYGR